MAINQSAKDSTLVHIETTSKCYNYFITLQAKCTLSCKRGALSVTFCLRLIVFMCFGSFCTHIFMCQSKKADTTPETNQNDLQITAGIPTSILKKR